MKTNVYEIEKGIYRISVAPHDGFEFNHFLIVDEKCMLIHTGGKKIFSTLSQLVSGLIDLNRLRYIAFSHFESDECGSLNNWLKIAQNAVPIVGTIGRETMLDFSEKQPEIVNDAQTIDLGENKVEVLHTPHVPHGWEACLFYEKVHGILFSSDLGAQPGINEPIAQTDITQAILNFQQQAGFIPGGESLKRVVSRLASINIKYMAPMHGSVLKDAQIKALFEAYLA